MVVAVGRSGKLTPPSTSVDGDKMRRLIVDFSPAMFTTVEVEQGGRR